MKTDPARAQINLMHIASWRLGLRGEIVDTDQLEATRTSFLEVIDGRQAAEIDEAIDFAVRHFKGAGVYKIAAVDLATTLYRGGHLEMIRAY